MAPVFPVLYTNRLVLRQIIPDDQMHLYLGLSNQRVIKYYGVEYHRYHDTAEQLRWYQELYVNKTGLWWALSTPDNSSLMGTCGIYNWQEQHRKAEIGFWLLPEYWQKGLMAEALRAIITYVSEELKVHRLEAYVETPNKASGNLLERLGFVKEGTLQDCEIKKGDFISLNVYARLNK